MSVLQTPNADYRIEAISSSLINRIWENTQDSVSIWNRFGSLQYDRFVEQLSQAVVGVWFPFGFAYLTQHGDRGTGEAHLIIWNRTYISYSGLISSACYKVMQLFNLQRIETAFPSHIRGLHRIMSREDFQFEGTLRKAITVENQCFDASMYSIVREKEHE